MTRKTRSDVHRLAHPIGETRELLGGLCRNTIFKLARQGRLQIIRAGDRPLVTRASIDRFLNGQA